MTSNLDTSGRGQELANCIRSSVKLLNQMIEEVISLDLQVQIDIDEVFTSRANGLTPVITIHVRKEL